MKLSVNYLRRNRNQRPRGPYYKYFSAYFDYMLYCENQIAADDHYDDWYVDDREVREFLEETRKSNFDHVYAITGLKGIGKTTHIRKVFGSNMEPSFSDDQLVIPYFLNNFSMPDMNFEKTRITGIIRKSIDAIKSNYRLEDDTEEFCEFIVKQKSTIIPLVTGDFDLGNRLNPQTVIDKLREQHLVAYSLMRFKYIASKSRLKRVQIIVDDLESAPSDFVTDLINFLVVVRNCLMNVRPLPKQFTVNLLVSCRPSTLEKIKSSSRVIIP